MMLLKLSTILPLGAIDNLFIEGGSNQHELNKLEKEKKTKEVESVFYTNKQKA